MDSETDIRHMRAAITLARRGLGRTWPNPTVGCVLVKDGHVIARGRTGDGGRPHAETVALEAAGKEAKGATAYVSLEPCSHHGQTPPCAQALIDAGISRCVIACTDPDPRVDGKGVDMLVKAGIEVTTGICGEEARAVNEGFFLKVLQNRPLITLKLASTLDGRIATHKGESRWITGEEARRYVHVLRNAHDAVMIGSGTVLADDPELTCRLDGQTRQPVRVILDARLRMPLTGKLAKTAGEVPVWVVTLPGNDDARIKAMRDLGIEVIEVPAEKDTGLLDLGVAMTKLSERGLTRILCEGGGHVAASLVQKQMADQLVWFRASRLIGDDGVSAVRSFGVDTLDQTADFVLSETRRIGDDIVETYSRTI